MSSACILIDVQEGYASRSYPSLTRINCVAPAIRKHMPIIWVYMQENGAELPLLKASSETYGEIFNRLAHHELNSCSNYDNAPLIKPSPEDWILTKTKWDAFTNDSLPAFLHSLNVTTPYFGGYVSSVCVLSSAVSSRVHGFKPELLSDLTNKDGAGPLMQKYFLDNRVPSCTSAELLLSLG